jgi:hypothetical protein
MKDAYKLKNEIKQFIVDQKKTNLKLSCRKLIPLIQEKFGIKLSKSLINNVIKENKLSSPVGRTRIREKILPEKAESLIIAPPLERTKPQPTEEKPGEPLVQPEAEISLKELPPQIEEKLPEQPAELPQDAGNLPQEQIPEETPKAQPIELIIVRKQVQFIQNGGCLFLVLADLKSSLTVFLREKFSLYLPNLPKDFLQTLIESQIYRLIFKDINSLWQFLGQEIPEKSLIYYLQALSQTPLVELNKELVRLGLRHNINEINELFKECLFWLNSYVQEQFFPSVYQFLDFSTMYSRFYRLPAKIEKRQGLFNIRFFYFEDSIWVQDIVLQEDFSFVANKINENKIYNRERERVWIDSSINLFDRKTVSFQ